MAYLRWIGRFLNFSNKSTTTAVAGPAIHQPLTPPECTTANQPRTATTPATIPNSTNLFGDITQHTTAITTQAIPKRRSKSLGSTKNKATIAHSIAMEAMVPSARSRYHQIIPGSKPKIRLSQLIGIASNRPRERRYTHPHRRQASPLQQAAVQQEWLPQQSWCKRLSLGRRLFQEEDIVINRRITIQHVLTVGNNEHLVLPWPSDKL